MISSTDDLRKCFLNNPYCKYNFYFNSSKNKRGVGILIKSGFQTEILEQRATEDENLLLLRIKIHNTEVILVSIYGPNSSDAQFFENIDTLLNEFQPVPIIMGGDWNCSFSTDNIRTNIDCFNMARLPNQANSNRLQNLCERFDLTDPYRHLYPDKREFSYTPRCDGNRNRSPLDFFLVSDAIVDRISDCRIAENLQNKLFDHKAVSLTFNEAKKSEKILPTISNKELDDDLLEFVVKISIVETYVIHCDAQVINGINRNFVLNTCGIIRRMIRECGPQHELCIGINITEEMVTARSRIHNRIRLLAGTLELHVFEAIELYVSPDIFMETLLNNVKNDTISHQSFIRKRRKEKISWLNKTISELKG
jgi:exonuclease III